MRNSSHGRNGGHCSGFRALTALADVRFIAMIVVGGLICLGSAACRSSGSPLHFTVTEEAWSFAGVDGTRLLTDHFDIHTTVRDEELRSALPAFVEACYREYSSLVPVADSKTAQPLEIFLFESRSQWERFTQARFPDRYAVLRRIRAGGYTRGDLCVCYELRDRGQTLSVLAHEGMHQFLSRYVGSPIPAWLHEGLATYVEAVDLAGETPKFTPQRNLYRMNSLRRALAGGELVPLRELLDTGAGTILLQGQSNRTLTYYAQSWALIAYLRHGADGIYAEGVDRLLADLADGSFRINAQAARLAAESPSTTTFGEALFRFYFTDSLSMFEDGYIAYLHDVTSMPAPPVGIGERAARAESGPPACPVASIVWNSSLTKRGMRRNEP